MSYFVWVLDKNHFGDIPMGSGIPNEFILPRRDAPEDVKLLVESSLWIVFRGRRGDLPFAYLELSQIEVIDEGINEHDLYLKVNASRSFICCANFDAENIQVISPSINLEKPGVQEIEKDVHSRIAHTVTNSITVKFAPPAEEMFAAIPRICTSEIREYDFSSYLSAITKRFTLDEIWSSKSAGNSPFANFAFYLAKRDVPLVSDSVLPQLCDLDPVHIPMHRDNFHYGSKSGVGRPPSVDTDFEIIDPKNIVARKFVAKNTAFDTEAILEKTQAAGKKHQEILRDISEYLLSRNLEPKQSASIDLFLSIEGSTFIFEIKTTHEGNLEAQCAKGCYQLARYRRSIVELVYESCRGVLLLEKTASKELDSFFAGVNSSLGIVTLFHDESVPWPNRIVGLDDLIGCESPE